MTTTNNTVFLAMSWQGLYRSAGLICALLLASISPIVFSQTPTQQFGPGGARPDIPKYEEESKPDFVLPKVAPPVKRDNLYDTPEVFVKRFEITGNTVFTGDELHKITAPYENRMLTTVEIQEVRRNITLHYINNGYINSGAILPDQKVTDGLIRLQVVEGELTSIQVSGNKRLKSGYISDRLLLGAGPPLNLKDMQIHLRYMQQNPLIKQVNAELGAGVKPGESVLRLLVEEEDPYQVVSFVDNYRSPSIGGYGAGIEASHSNLTGRGDTISARYIEAEGLEELALSYEIPLSARDTTFRFHYQGSDAVIEEEPFNILDVTSKSRTFGFELSHPFYRTPNEELVVGIGFDHRRSETYLLGQPFSFSEGPDDGLSKASVIRFFQTWDKRLPNEVYSIRSLFSLGIDAFNATIHGGNPPLTACGVATSASNCADGDFLAWLGQLQYARRFTLRERLMQMIFRGDIQLSKDPLLPLEKFSMGGARTVRGYRENQLVRDNGLIASLELRIPVLLNTEGISQLQLAPFIDHGESWNTNSDTPDPRRISSAGIGLLWDPHPYFHIELYLAKALRKVTGESDKHDLQDSGVHFQMSYRFF
jgi:hemolysin activation/secretion protein